MDFAFRIASGKGLEMECFCFKFIFLFNSPHLRFWAWFYGILLAPLLIEFNYTWYANWTEMVGFGASTGIQGFPRWNVESSYGFSKLMFSRVWREI